ncbi:putative pectate lyase 3 [Zea mays]|uniref:Putative pectate lyase 3 n=1 Tax=Zea mays TaxID=4577 RepID=A0A1D6P2H4_MAIZE|nr:putative pectate lyase 3 [Zea mays]
MVDGFRWIRPGSFVLYLVFFFLSAALSEANIGDFDEYWQQRKLMADAAAEATYKHDPVEVANQLNRAVHRSVEKEDIGTRREMMGTTTRKSKFSGPCRATNPIDRCWRCRQDWATDRKRLAHRLRRRRHHRLRLHQRVAGPPLPLQLPGRPHRRHRQVHRRHHLQLPPHQPQRCHALQLQRQASRGPDHADHCRLQPLRQRPRAEDAKVPLGLLPRGQQRLHALAHVRHRRQQGPHHHQPGQPLHRAAQPCREAGHQAA